MTASTLPYEDWDHIPFWRYRPSIAEQVVVRRPDWLTKNCVVRRRADGRVFVVVDSYPTGVVLSPSGGGPIERVALPLQEWESGWEPVVEHVPSLWQRLDSH